MGAEYTITYIVKDSISNTTYSSAQQTTSLDITSGLSVGVNYNFVMYAYANTLTSNSSTTPCMFSFSIPAPAFVNVNYIDSKSLQISVAIISNLPTSWNLGYSYTFSLWEYLDSFNITKDDLITQTSDRNLYVFSSNELALFKYEYPPPNPPFIGEAWQGPQKRLCSIQASYYIGNYIGPSFSNRNFTINPHYTII